MAGDDEKPHDWDPERERAQVDPDKLARMWVRAAAEEATKIEEEKAAAWPPAKRIGALLPPPASGPPARDPQDHQRVPRLVGPGAAWVPGRPQRH